MKIKEFIRSLPINQIIEVYDGSHTIVYHGKAGFAYPKLNYLDDDFISSTEEDFTDIDGKSGKRILINAAKRQDLPRDYQNIYDDVAQYIRRVVEDAFDDLGSTKLSCNVISDEIKTYSAEWGSETETSEMARLREDAINATINAFLEGCFDDLPKDISSSRRTKKLNADAYLLKDEEDSSYDYDYWEEEDGVYAGSINIKTRRLEGWTSSKLLNHLQSMSSAAGEIIDVYAHGDEAHIELEAADEDEMELLIEDVHDTLLTTFNHVNSSRSLPRVPTNASIQPGLVTKIFEDISMQINMHGGASAALVSAWEDIDGQVDLIAMLVQAAGGYDLYHTSDGFFNDEDYLIVKAGADIDPVFANLEMQTPNDLEKI